MGTTRSAAAKKKQPAPRFQRKDARPLSVKCGNMSKQIVAKKAKLNLSKKEQMDLLMSQPQDAMSDDEESSMSSIDGLAKKQGSIKKKEDLPATIPDDSESSDDDDHFGV